MHCSLRLLCYLLYLSFACFVDAKAYFTVIDDDAKNVQSIASVKRVADKYNIKVCFGVISGRLTNRDLIDSLLKYQSEDFQILNHSLFHGDMWKKPTEEDVVFEIERSEYILDSLGFINHNYFVYPFGKYDCGVRQWMLPIVSKYFLLAFESRGYGNDITSTNSYFISRFPLRKFDNLFCVKRVVDKAIKNNQWIVFLNHSGMERDYSEQFLDDVVGYCIEQGMTCVTVSEAYNLGICGSKNVKAKVWTWFDEIEYLLYMRVLWVAMVLFFIISFIVWKYIHLSR